MTFKEWLPDDRTLRETPSSRERLKLDFYNSLNPYIIIHNILSIYITAVTWGHEVFRANRRVVFLRGISPYHLDVKRSENERNEWKQWSKQRLKRSETAIKGSVLESYTQTKCTGICVACALDDMFSGFNTARKAVLLTRKS